MPRNQPDCPESSVPSKSAESIRDELASRDITEEDVVRAIDWARAFTVSGPAAPGISADES